MFGFITSAVKSVAKAAGNAVAGTAKQIGEGISNVATAAGAVAQKALDTARNAVDEHLGDSLLGGLARGLIDTAKVAAGVLELGGKIFGAVVSATGQILGALIRLEPGAIPGILTELVNAVIDAAEQFIDQIASYALKQQDVVRSVPGIARPATRAWSMAASLRNNAVSTPDPRTYRDTGKHYEFRLTAAGDVEYRETTMTSDEPGWTALRRRPGDRNGTAISYDERRLGQEIALPPMEMIVSTADRVFAKERGRDVYYFLLMDELFYGLPTMDPTIDQDNASFRHMPSNYFKLDPETNRPGSRGNDRVQALEGVMPSMPQAERLPLFKEAMRLGLMGMMVSVEQKVWYRIDSRPPLHAAQAPSNLPRYIHATYEATLLNRLNPLPAITQHSIDYRKVLDIGVGNMHFHEHWLRIHGGEMQAQFVENAFNIKAYSLSYAIMNGPIFDSDGFCDGTTNFYLLVELPDNPTQRYAILFCDEQSLFSQRWRNTEFDDNEWVAQSVTTTRVQLNFSLASSLTPGRDAALHNYRAAHVWSPFRQACITSDSRMTVNRQVIIVSGIDARTGRHELYSRNFSYGSGDRTWRWRGLDQQGFTPRLLTSDDVARGAQDSIHKTTDPMVVFPQTIHLREDMTLTMRGTAMDPTGHTEPGYWVQPYLPATHEHVPSAEEHATANTGRSNAEKPARGYDHPWQFWPENAFRSADRFSHWGVYAAVDSRRQYYAVDLLDKDPLADGEEWVYRDRPATARMNGSSPGLGKLYIKARKLSYKSLSEWLTNNPLDTLVKVSEIYNGISGGNTNFRTIKGMMDDHLHTWENGPVSTAEADRQFRASSRSMYNFDGRFRLLDRGPLGWIAVWADKRDDDLIPLSDLPMEVVLEFPTRKAAPPTVRVRFKRCQVLDRPPAVASAQLEVLQNDQAPTVKVRLHIPLTPHELADNIWQVHLGILDAQRSSPATILHSCRFHEHFFAVDGAPGTYEGTLSIRNRTAAEIHDFVSKTGHARYATSLWFEGPTGLMASAAHTTFLEQGR